MAENRESVILQVGLDAGKVSQQLAGISKQLGDIKDKQKDLTQQYKEGNITLAQYTAETAKLKDEQTWLQKEQKGLIATTKLLDATEKTYGNTLNDERQKLADMQKAYDQLDKTMRESEGGQKYLKAIKEQSDEVKRLEEQTGRAQRNVGNYADAMQKAGIGVGNFTNKLKLMLKNPLVAVFSALVAVFHKLRDAFKRNNDAGTSFSKALAAFKPIVTAINSIFSALANIIAKVANAFAKIGGFIARLIPGYRQAAEAAQELVDVQDRLQDQERQFAVESAKRARDVAQLRDAVAGASEATDGYVKIETKRLKLTDEGMAKAKQFSSVFGKFTKDIQENGIELTKLTKEQIEALKASGAYAEETATETLTAEEALERAIALEKEELQQRLDIAKEKVRIQEETMRQNNDYSDEAKDKLAQLTAELYNAETAYYTGVKKLDKELTSSQEKERKEREEQEKKAAAARLEIERAKQDKLLSLETDGTKKQIEQTRIAGEREVENLRIKLDNLKKDDLKARAELKELIAATEKATQKQIDAIQIQATKKREETITATRREAAKRGVKDSIELAKLQVQATEEDYLTFQRMTEQEILTLYGTWENYYQQLAQAETARYNAREDLALEEYNRNRQRIENEYNARIADIDNEYALNEIELQHKQEQYNNLLTMDEEQKALLFANEEEYKAAMIDTENAVASATEKAVKSRMQSIGMLGDTMTEMASALGEFAGESEEAAKAQKAFAFSGILLNQAQSISEGALAIAKGVESAAGIPFPANIPAVLSVVAQIGSMIAGVMTSIAQAKQIFSQADAGSFAGGGTIEGDSYTGDRLIAHVNSGEGIYNGKQANNILQEIANNPLRGGMEQLTEAMTTAIEAMPAPVMILRELRDFESNVATYNEIASV